MTAIDLAARYLAGADVNGSAAEFEDSLFQDPELVQAAAWLLDLRSGLKDLTATGPAVPVITPSQLTTLIEKRRVLQLVPMGSAVDASIDPKVEFVALRLPVRLDDARSIDIEFWTPTGDQYFRVHEAPFDPAANEVIVFCARHVALAAGNIRLVVRDDLGAARAEFTLRAREPSRPPI